MIKTTKLGRDGMVRVTFTLPVAEPTGAVSVVGDFNDWDPFAHPLRRRAKGIRSASVTVPPGSTLRFRYLAEGGQWFDDETISMNGGRDAILAVLSALSTLSTAQGLAEQVLGDPGQVDPHRLHRGA